MLDFAEQKLSVRKWPIAQKMNREFVVQLRQFLVTREVTPNGRPGAQPKLMSERQIINCMETLRAAIAWGLKASVRKLPPEFANPVTHDLVGKVAAKDPLRAMSISVDRRAEVIGMMDQWQLLHLSILFVLPLRFEDVSGMLISDINFETGHVKLVTRFGGCDFNKGKVEVRMPLPAELLSLMRLCSQGRAEGPLHLNRCCWARPPKSASFGSRQELKGRMQSTMRGAGAHELRTEQDKKQIIRKTLCMMGAVSVNQISKQLTCLLGKTRPYDIRGSLTQSMQEAGVGHLTMRYMTLHAVNDILNEYSGVNSDAEMRRYFISIAPVLGAIRERASSFGIDLQTPQEIQFAGQS